MAGSYKYAIIGSGAAAGIVAAKLSRTRDGIVVVEAGKHYTARDFPMDQYNLGRLYWKSALQFTADFGTNLTRGMAVGGSSVVYQALFDEFSEDVWERWRRKSGVPFFSSKEMSTHYRDVLGGFHTEIIPEARQNENARIFTAGMSALGYRTRRLRRAQRNCRPEEGYNCIDCFGGCPIDSKESSLINGIAQAVDRGVELKSEFAVRTIRRGGGRFLINGRGSGGKEQFYAENVVLAAGALGSTEILLRSGYKRALPALGEAFWLHPTYYSFGLFPRIIDAHAGAFQSVASDDPRLHAMGIKLESMAHPFVSLAMLLPLNVITQEYLESPRNIGCVETALRPDAHGRITIDIFGTCGAEYSPCRKDMERKEHGLEICAEILRGQGARSVVHSKLASAVHLMGGCAMGTDARKSVVNPSFEVHGFRNLYVVDSSLFVDAPGYNPSLSVMALASRAADGIAA